MGYIPADVVLGLTSDNWAASLAPYADAPGIGGSGASDKIMIIGK
jgi:hypothetical protein